MVRKLKKMDLWILVMKNINWKNLNSNTDKSLFRKRMFALRNYTEILCNFFFYVQNFQFFIFFNYYKFIHFCLPQNSVRLNLLAKFDNFWLLVYFSKMSSIFVFWNIFKSIKNQLFFRYLLFFECLKSVHCLKFSWFFFNN